MRTKPLLCFLAASVGAVAIGFAADLYVLEHVARRDTNDTDWGQMFRSAGYIPTWCIVALGLLLVDLWAKPPAGRYRVTRGLTLAGSVWFAGVAAELLKLVTRRLRPDAEHPVLYAIRPFAEETYAASGMCLPSGHASVAFAAAFMLCRLHPGGAPVWLAIAAGCAATRLLMQAHYLSDVLAGAVVAYAVAWAIWQVHLLIVRPTTTPTTISSTRKTHRV